MGFEIEVKFRVADLASRWRRIWPERGIAAEPTVEHHDAYLAHPARDFAQTGEAFRIQLGRGIEPDHL